MRAATLLALALAIAAPGDARAGDEPVPPATFARVVRHRIEARLEPATHRVVARDVLDLEGDGRALTFSLPSTARVSAVLVEGGEPLHVGAGGDERERLRRQDLAFYQVDLPAEARVVEVRYDGELLEGTFSEKGPGLVAERGWYPEPRPAGLCRFDVTTYVPAPFLVVTQGGVPQRSAVAFPKDWTSETEVAPPATVAGAQPGVTYHRSEVRAVMPADRCALCAGPYRVETREIQGIPVSTYFLPGEAPDAGLWLDAAKEVLDRYERVFGSYPHPKFDLVEGLRSTPHGMPSYVVIRDDALREATSAARARGGGIDSDALDHAYVHGWFGDGLLADGDHDAGWCEALTTYVSSALRAEWASPAAGAARRRTLLESNERDPREGTASVGAARGALAFHMARRRLGDEAFFARVQRFTSSRLGTRVGWDDWWTLLDAAWVRPGLDRKAPPAIRLASASGWPERAADGPGAPEPGRFVVRADARIEPAAGEGPWPPFDLDVDVDGEKVGTLRVEGWSGTWRGVVPRRPKTLELDARAEVLRQVGDAWGSLRRPIDVGDEVAARIDATVAALASDAAEGRRPGTLGHDRAAGTLATELLQAGFQGIEGVGTSGFHEFGLGVADLLSSRDLVLSTEAGTETIPDAFWPIFASPERARGRPLPYAEGAGAVPAPGRLPDASPEGLARFSEQVDSGTAPALLIAPSPATRQALAPLLDAPNALTPQTQAFYAAAGAEGKPRFPTALGLWIGRARARAMPGATPLRVPVLVLSDEAIARLEGAPTVTAIDFEIRFGPEHATWAAGKGGKNIVLGRIPAHLPTEATPVVVLSAHYDGLGRQGDALYRGAGDGASGVACVLAAARALAADFAGPDAKAGLVVCLFDGEAQGLLGSRALAPRLARRFRVLADVDVGAVGRVRDDTVRVRGAASDPALATRVATALASAGLVAGRGPDAVAFAGDLESGPFRAAGIPTIAFRASDEAVRETPMDVAEGVDPVGIARLSVAVAALVRALAR